MCVLLRKACVGVVSRFQILLWVNFTHGPGVRSKLYKLFMSYCCLAEGVLESRSA